MQDSGRSWDDYLRVELVENALGPGLGEVHNLILDVGAGTSSFVQEEFPTESHIVRVDLERKGRIQVACSVTNLPFRNETFDLVVALRVLQHVPRETEALGEILRVTKPGGHILLAVANRNSWTLLRARLENPKWRKRIPYAFYRLYLRDELETKLRRTGLVGIRIRSAIFLPEAINRLPMTVTRALIKLGVAIDWVARRIPFIQNMGTNWVVFGVKS